MWYVDLLGYVGSFLLATMTLPQTLKIYLSKSANDVSYVMIGMLAVGYAFFLAYGVLLPFIPIVSSTSLSLFNLSLLFGFKLRYREKRTPVSSCSPV